MRKFLSIMAILMLLLPSASIVGNAKNSDQLLSLPNQSLTTTSEEVNPQWVEWAIDDRRGTSDEFYELQGEWTVPSPPPEGNVVFIGIMLDNHPGHPEYRGVGAFIWWGFSDYGGGPYWSLGVDWVQWVGPGNWDFVHVEYSAIEDATETGHTVHGEVFRDPFNSTNWIAKIFDKTQYDPDQVCRAEFADTAFPYQLASVSLQIPDFISSPAATKLPGTTYFRDLGLVIQGYEPTTPIWIGGQNYYGYGLGVSHDSTWVRLHTGVSSMVGGVIVPVDKFGLLAPYTGLASTILVATAATAIYVKRRKEKR